MTKKKILIIDTNNETILSLKFLIKEYTEFEAIIKTDLEAIINSYKENFYEFIIIEHTCDNSDDIINHICTNSPKQKVILLSDSINCPIECSNCLKILSFVRLLKPLDLKDILEYLNHTKDFTCPNKFRFDKINTIEKLYAFINLKNYRFFTYKKIENEKLIIYSPNEEGTLLIGELKNISENINKKYFSFEVIDNTIVIGDIKL